MYSCVVRDSKSQSVQIFNFSSPGKNSFFLCFKRCQKELAKLPIFQKVLSAVHGYENRLGKFVNKLLCHEENLILQSAIECVGSGNVLAPMFDGFLALKALLDADETVSKLNCLPCCQERSIKWDTKTHDGDIQVDPEYVGKESFHAPNDVLLVEQLAKHLYEQNRLAVCRGTLWYLSGTETWIDDFLLKSEFSLSFMRTR
jgi:hypothetical protein